MVYFRCLFIVEFCVANEKVEVDDKMERSGPKPSKDAGRGDIFINDYSDGPYDV